MNSQFERSGKAQAQTEREFQATIRHYLRRCVLLQIRHYQRHTLDILRRVDWSGFPIWWKKWQGQLLEAAGYTANALVCDVAMSCVVEIDKQPFSFPFLFMSSGSSPMIFASWSFRKQPVPEVLHEALGRRTAPQLAASSLSQAAKSCCLLPVFWNQELTFPFPSWSRLVLVPWFHLKFGGQPCSKANRGGRDATSKREPVRAKLRVPRRELPVRKLPKLELILRNSLNMCSFTCRKVFLTNQSRFVPA